MKIKSKKPNYVGKKSTCSVSTQTRRRRGNISEPGAKIDRGIPFWGTFAKTNKMFVVLNFEKQKPNSTLRSETNKTERKYFRSGNKNRSRNSFLGKLLSRRLQYENYQYIPISRFENRLVFIVSSVWVYGRDIIHGCGLNSVASPCERSLCALFFALCSVVQMCSCFESHSYWSNSVQCT